LIKRTLKAMNIDAGDGGEGRDPLKQFCNRIAKAFRGPPDPPSAD
jgi:hypothetical protein